MHIPNFGGLSGSEDKGGGDNSIQFINFGGWVTKGLKNGDKNRGGGRVGDNNILTVCRTVVNKNATFLFIFARVYLFIKLKKLHFG